MVDGVKRPILWILAGLVLLIIAIQDLTAASIVVVGALAIVLMVRNRGSKMMRTAAVIAIAGVTLVGVVAALAGADLSRAVKVNVFLADVRDFARFNPVYAEAFPGDRPARTTVQATLPLPGMKIEIEAILVID